VVACKYHMRVFCHTEKRLLILSDNNSSAPPWRHGNTNTWNQFLYSCSEESELQLKWSSCKQTYKGLTLGPSWLECCFPVCAVTRDIITFKKPQNKQSLLSFSIMRYHGLDEDCKKLVTLILSGT